MSNGQTVGYIRVSSQDQNSARQLEGAVLHRTFTDKCSGKDTNRPQLKAVLEFLREGDTLVVHSMDRLARNLDDLRKIVTSLTDRGVEVRFVKESLTFTGADSPMANLLLSVMGAFAQFERELIRERQKEGIAIAQAKGAYRGRKPVLDVASKATLRKLIDQGLPKVAIAKELGISRASLYTYLKEMETR